MLERLRHVVDEYETIERQLADSEVLADSDEVRRLSKRYNELGPVVDAYRRREARRADGEAAREMLAGASGEEREMLVAEIDAAGVSVSYRIVGPTDIVTQEYNPMRVNFYPGRDGRISQIACG